MFRIVLACALLLALPAAADHWCLDADTVTAEVRDGLVVVEHGAAFYNCCPEPIVYDLVVEGDVLDLTETVLEESPCDCLCCFDLGVVLRGVAPGDWTLRFRWLDNESWTWTSVDVPVTVPAGAAADGGPAVHETTNSGCHTHTGIEQPESVFRTWSGVKARYR